MSISALISEKNKVYLAGESYVLLPYTLGMTAKLAKYYEEKGKTINYLQEIFLRGEVNSEFINVVIETIYLFIEDPKETLGEFSDKILKKEKDITKLVTILTKIMGEADPIYDLEDKKKVKKSQIILGWAVLMFSVIGLIVTILWLIDMATSYMISLN